MNGAEKKAVVLLTISNSHARFFTYTYLFLLIFFFNLRYCQHLYNKFADF